MTMKQTTGNEAFEKPKEVFFSDKQYATKSPGLEKTGKASACGTEEKTNVFLTGKGRNLLTKNSFSKG